MPEPIDYKSSGVDLDAYEQTMALLPRLLKRTYTPRVIEWPGGFAGLFRLDANIGLFTRTYRDPVLVASTDGVGTKLKLAFATGRHETVGIDLVAMSVNDCLCAGAEPLLFLDYVAMSRDDPSLTEKVVQGISDGCVEAECALLGGETAILPDFYHPGEYDLAGFCLGRRRPQADPRRQGDPARRQGDRPGQLGPAFQRLQPGPEARLRGRRAPARLVRPRAGLHGRRRVPQADPDLRPGLEDGLSPLPGQADRPRDRPHHRRRPDRQPARGSCPKAAPSGSAKTWDVPKVFPWLQSIGKVPDAEMFRVFNMGIGLVLIVAEYYAEAITRYLRTEVDLPAWVIGEVVDGDRTVEWEDPLAG